LAQEIAFAQTIDYRLKSNSLAQACE